LDELYIKRYKQNKIDSLISLASDLKNSNKIEAKLLLEEAVDSAERIEYKKGIAEVNRILGIINTDNGNYILSFDQLQMSLEIFKEIGFDEGITKTNINQGVLFRQVDLTNLALESYMEAIDSDFIKTDSSLLCAVNNNIANIKFSQKKYEEAIEYYRSNLEIYKFKKDTVYIIDSYTNLGDTEAQKNPPDYSVALDYLKKSKELAEEINDTLRLMNSYKYLGRTYLRMKALEEAEPRLSQAYELASILVLPRHILSIAEDLKTFYDTVNNEERFKYYQNIIDDYENKYKIEESSKEIANIIQRKKEDATQEIISKQNAFISIVIVILLIATLFILTLYWNYRNKQRANKLLREMDELKTRLYSNITHELRTPLTLILGPLEEMLAAESDRKPSRKQVKMMRKNADTLLNLVNQMLDLAKVDANSLKLELSEADVVKFVKVRFAAFASLANQKKITYNYLYPDEKITGIFDTNKLEKIINNLVSNAIKFTPKNGEVSCEVTIPKSNRFKLTVSDSGKGIPEHEMDKIFDRFHQVGGAENYNKIGTGIGLSLTKELVELMHGNIEVESVVGKGTVFTVTIPLGAAHLNKEEYAMVHQYKSEEEKQDVPEETDPETAEECATSPSETENEQPVVLVVEDHEEIREFIEENIRDCYKVVQAENGKTGLKTATEQVPDLIVSDVLMPEMDGFEMCKKIKTDERTSHIPVILLTAKSADKDKLQGLETGADAYLTKPFNMKELRIRIKNLIEQRKKLRERFKQNLNLEPKEIAVTSADEKFINRAMEIIEKHMGDSEFEVRQFQEEMFMSRMQLFRKIKALTNQTPGEFIRTIRLKRAAQLMDQNFGNIAQITFEVGFNNPSYFAKCFKDLYGKLPSEYIKRADNDPPIDPSQN